MKRIILLTLALFASRLDAGDTLHLSIGDPERKQRTVALTLDGLTDAHNGEFIELDALPARLAGINLLLIGENHTSSESHRVQLKVMETLTRSGRKVLLGLEMYPHTSQQHLDAWTQNLLTEEGFVKLSEWYRNWGYNWNYYREIFLLARERRVPVYGVNIPRPVVTAVRRKGFEELSQEERSHLPETVDTDNEDHFQLFKAFLGGEGFHASLSDEQLKGMFNAQCTWDAAMAHHAVHALRKHADENPIMVVLVGSGHVAYGLGIERQARRMFEGGTATLIPLPVRDEDNEVILDVQASFADFVWGVPWEPFTRYPSLGISVTPDEESGHLQVLFVQDDTPAALAGVRRNDYIRAMDGRPVHSRAQLNQLIAGKEWGDSARLSLLREEEELTLNVSFRRILETKEETGQEEH